MKQDKILSLLKQYAAPAGLIVLGAALALNPDALSYLIAKFLGWGILLVGIGFGISALAGHDGTVRKLLWAIAAFAVSSWLIRHPLSLASQVGKFLGLVLVIRGIQEARRSVSDHGRLLGIAMAVVGVVLLLAPMTATRLVFSLCGVAVLAVGIAMLVDRWKSSRYLDDSGNHDIIDAL